MCISEMAELRIMLGVLRDYITEGLPKYMNPWIHDKQSGLSQLDMISTRHKSKLFHQQTLQKKQWINFIGETLYVGFLDEWEYVTYMDSMLAGAAPTFVQPVI